MNSVDPRAWLADVLRRLPDYPANCIADLDQKRLCLLRGDELIEKLDAQPDTGKPKR